MSNNQVHAKPLWDGFIPAPSIDLVLALLQKVNGEELE